MDQVIHADLSVAAGRLFFLVLQVSKYEENNKEKPIAVEAYATKVWLPLKSSKYEMKEKLQSFQETRSVDSREYESGYYGYYAYYKIIPINGDKPILFKLVSESGIGFPTPGPSKDMWWYVKALSIGLFSAAYYAIVTFFIWTSHLTSDAKGALVYGLPSALTVLFSIIEIGAVKGNLVTKIVVGVARGVADFFTLPWTVPARALTHTPLLAKWCLTLIAILATWLAIDRHARDDVRDRLQRHGFYERPDAGEQENALGSEVFAMVRSYFGGKNADNTPKRRRGRPLERMVRNLGDIRERQQQMVEHEEEERIGR